MKQTTWTPAALSLALGLALQATFVSAQLAPALPPVQVYAPSPCPVCADWTLQLRQRGFVVTLEEKQQANMLRMKRWLNVPSQLEAMQTTRVAGYFLEGSVPGEDLIRLLKEKPKARGLAVSGGVPGRDKFNTMLVGPDGLTSIYARH
jgi:hypothetical protein